MWFQSSLAEPHTHTHSLKRKFISRCVKDDRDDAKVLHTKTFYTMAKVDLHACTYFFALFTCGKKAFNQHISCVKSSN